MQVTWKVIFIFLFNYFFNKYSVKLASRTLQIPNNQKIIEMDKYTDKTKMGDFGVNCPFNISIHFIRVWMASLTSCSLEHMASGGGTQHLLCPAVSMERDNLVRYISLSHKPVGATLYATHAHTDSHCVVSLFDRPTKLRLYFYYNGLSDLTYILHSLVYMGLWM